jgi:hypothetical protein
LADCIRFRARLARRTDEVHDGVDRTLRALAAFLALKYAAEEVDGQVATNFSVTNKAGVTYSIYY